MYRPKIGEDESKGFLTYAERFAEDYKRFKASDPSAERTGTPLEHAPFLTQARVFELRAINIHTVETLAHLSEAIITKHHLRPVVAQAKTWLGETEAAAAVMEANERAERAAAEKAEVEGRFAALEAKLAQMSAGIVAIKSDDPDTWSDEELRAYLTSHEVNPRANASRDKLVAAAREIASMESAA
jgi:CRISPR/Cas system-associated endonuclease/helicase Cas3